MNIHEAFIALDEGKAISQVNGEEVIYSLKDPHMNNKVSVFRVCVEDYDTMDESCKFYKSCSFKREEIEATDWIIYERPRDLPT